MENKLLCENIIIEGTNYCNAKCIYCPREKYIHKLQPMPFNLYTKIINEAAELGLKSIGFSSFGEPLCDPYFIERLKYAKSKVGNANISVTTTLFLLKDNQLEDFIEYVDVIHISFSGMTAETYEKIHGGTIKFERAKNNVLNLIKKKKLLKSKSPSIVMRYLLMERINENEMQEYIKFWEPLVDEVMVWKPHNIANGRSYRKFDSKSSQSCGRPFSGVYYFDIEGRVTVCCYDFNKKLSIGNVSEQTIKEILLGQKLKKLRKQHNENDFNSLCKFCDQRDFVPDVLVYSTDKTRKLREFNMIRKEF